MNKTLFSCGMLAASIATLVIAGCSGGDTAATTEPPEATTGGGETVAQTYAHHSYAEAKAVFDTNCLGCHGGGKGQGRLNLDTVADITKGGESGPGVVAGDADNSLIIQHMRGEKEQMPPNNKLPDDQIEIIAGWIAAGAPAE